MKPNSFPIQFAKRLHNHMLKIFHNFLATMSAAMSNGFISNGIMHTGNGSTDTKLANAISDDATTAATAVLKPSIPMPSTSTKIQGVDFNNYEKPITVQQLTSHFLQTGFQASNLGRAIEIINNMVLQSNGVN